jgi:hypothetical protein
MLRKLRGATLFLLLVISLLFINLPAPVFADPAAGSLPIKTYLPFLRQVPEGMFVDVRDRQAVLNFYNQDYLGWTSAAIGWTGSQAACTAGVTSAAFKDAVAHRINYFRAMAGVPPVITFADAANLKAQAAALMMSANGNLSHSPPSSWKCYSSTGAAGAGSSNLAMGAYGWNAITMYMRDPGSGNTASGHRRWILYPPTLVMGTGDVPGGGSYWSTNSLVVFGYAVSSPAPAPRDGFVAWPPAGYVPYPLVFARWSFSVAGADFSAATVSMSSNGSPISVTQSPIANGYGDNTLVWIPLGLGDSANWPAISADATYNVTVSNVKISGAPRSFSYSVTVFNP